MRDFRIYWKNYAVDCNNFGFGIARPLIDWRTSATRFFEAVQPGDWLWFFTSGQACDMPATTAGYLVHLFCVERKEPNKGDDTHYPTEEFRYAIWAATDRCFWLDPPLLVDAIIRPGEHPADRHIGQLIQGPQAMKDAAVAMLEKALQRDRSELFARLSAIRDSANGGAHDAEGNPHGEWKTGPAQGKEIW